jgi:glutamate 5-kinase
MTASRSSIDTDPAAHAGARARAGGGQRWVVKIGSALVTRDGSGLDAEGLAGWAAQVAALTRGGRQVVVVTSGAVADGMLRLGLKSRPRSLHELQAAAAVGQMGLIRAWEEAFALHGLHTALVLLTHEDVAARTRYLNARSTLRTLLGYGVVPVINENDTVATDEIRFGDNDTLAALVANLVEADLLLILTDQSGLHVADPRLHPGAERVGVAHAADARLDAMVGEGGGGLGRGGMVTKLRAARIAARSGAATWIAAGRTPGVIGAVAAGDDVGTLLLPTQARLESRKQWIAGHLHARGVLTLDVGAVRALRDGGRSLLPVGVLKASGSFARGDVVACVSEEGVEIARGLVNYGIEDTLRIVGRSSEDIAGVLGFVAEPELVHRDNLVLLDAVRQPAAPGP